MEQLNTAELELPDPESFAIFIINDSYEAYCPECHTRRGSPNNKLSSGFICTNGEYVCQMGIDLASRERCEYTMKIDDEYNQHCNVILKEWYKTYVGENPSKLSHTREIWEIYSLYSKYYNEWEPLTKPALEE